MYLLQKLESDGWKEIYRCRYRKPLADELKRRNTKTHRIIEVS